MTGADKRTSFRAPAKRVVPVAAAFGLSVCLVSAACTGSGETTKVGTRSGTPTTAVDINPLSSTTAAPAATGDAPMPAAVSIAAASASSTSPTQLKSQSTVAGGRAAAPAPGNAATST